MKSSRPEVDFRSASWRLALQTGALLVLLLIVIASSVLAIVSTSQAAAAQKLLEAATEHVDSVQDAPAGVWLAIVDHGQLSVSAGMPPGLPDQEAMEAAEAGNIPVQADVSVGGRSFTIRTTASGDRIVQAVFDRHENQEELGRLALALFLTCGGAVILVSLLAVWLARRAMRPMAEALNLQRRFVADASHELRTPLTLLSTRAQMLRRRLTASAPAPVPSAASSPIPPLSVEASVDAIIADTRALTSILEDLLVSADSREADRVILDVVAVADAAVQSFSEMAQRAGLTLTRSGVDGPLQISAVPVALRRLFVALLDNALRFARLRIDVSITSNARAVLITVSDDGPGFADELRPRAFERFATTRTGATDSSGNPQSRHYGLGLALVAEVAAQHGGTVSLAPTSSTAGAVIVVTLPRKRY